MGPPDTFATNRLNEKRTREAAIDGGDKPRSGGFMDGYYRWTLVLSSSRTLHVFEISRSLAGLQGCHTTRVILLRAATRNS